MSAECGKHRGICSGRAAADDSDGFNFSGWKHFTAVINIFMSGAGINRALGMTAIDKFIDTALLIADAWANLINFSGIDFVRPLRIGKQRTRQHDHVAFFIAQRLFGKIGITKLAHRHNRYFKPRIGAYFVFGKIIFYNF